MSNIFLSHAVADKPLAQLIVNFLKEAIGVPSDDIFCSSIDGHGVPMTEDFNSYMKKEIQEPKIVLLLMTPSYMESAFCMMELGAAWAKSLVTLPIVVPPLSFGDVTKTLGLVQAWDIKKHSGLIDLRTTILEADIKLEKRSEHVWDAKRIEWRASSKKIISKLPVATQVSAQTHKDALETIEEKSSEIADLESLLEVKDQIIAKLKEAKDAAAVEAIMKEASGEDDPSEIFAGLIDDVKATLPTTSRTVLMHIIMDHYDKASRIDWYNDRQEFEDAIQRNLIEKDDGNPVAWGRPKLSKLRKALEALDYFLASADGMNFLKKLPPDSSTEADDLEFWQENL